MSEEELQLECRACGEHRPLTEYRYFTTAPVSYMDFCVHCERKHSTLTLYRRFNTYGTPEITAAVFAAERVPVGHRSEAQVRLLVPAQVERAVETPEEAIQRELARRELCRRRLVYYVTSFQPDYKPGWVHQDICRRLERFVQDVEKGKSPRLMIAMPPRAGKSALVSDMFPSWVLGHHPEWGIIGASHSIGLPIEFSRNIRDRLQLEEYQAIFSSTAMRKDARGVEEWKTDKGGGYIAAGVGTGINGKGCYIGIGDDLIKDAEAAASDVIRASALAWYQTVFYTRLAPGGGLLLVGTRWHDADVQGSLLEKENMLRNAGVPAYELDNWDVVSYPALAEADEYLLSTGQIWRGDLPEGEESARRLRFKDDPLHPERYPLEALLRIKNMMPKQQWSALYQQNPTPDDGEFFKRHDLRYQLLGKDYRKLARRFMTADYALKKNQRNDYTVLIAWALDANDDLYVLDVVRGRWGSLEIARNIVEMIIKHEPEVYAGEQGQVHEAVWPIVTKELQKKQKGVSVDNTLIPIVDKETRARPVQWRTQTHKLLFSYDSPTPPPIYDEVEKEMLRFPNGTHDDIVDALAWGARLAMNLTLPTVRAPKPLKSWRDELLTVEGGGSHMAA